MVERLTIRNIQEEEPIYVPDGDPPAFIPIHLSVDTSAGLYPGDQLVPASDYEQLLARHTALVRAIENWANEEHASVAGCEVYCADVAQRLSQLITEHGGGGSGSEKCRNCSRPMIHQDAATSPNDPAIDCGGNCSYCQWEFERDNPDDGQRHPKPNGERFSGVEGS